MSKPNLLISECLCGVCCRYDGDHNKIDCLEELKSLYNLIPVCPEVLGGLLTPRPPAERIGDRVQTRNGIDVTEQFKRGAELALAIAIDNNCLCALLKAKSPSCGYGEIYDGSFTRTIVNGLGVTSELLLQHNIQIYTEKNVQDLIKHNSDD
ncbi:MAG: DUF523 domain-containing protein [Veillonella sp.]|nr:DUF523 domain-containing protein [Veillonella sp.]